MRHTKARIRLEGHPTSPVRRFDVLPRVGDIVYAEIPRGGDGTTRRIHQVVVRLDHELGRLDDPEARCGLLVVCEPSPRLRLDLLQIQAGEQQSLIEDLQAELYAWKARYPGVDPENDEEEDR